MARKQAKEAAAVLPDTSRQKFAHSVSITSCDDATEVTLDLTDTEFAGVRRLAEASAAASVDPCQPVVRVLS